MRPLTDLALGWGSRRYTRETPAIHAPRIRVTLLPSFLHKVPWVRQNMLPPSSSAVTSDTTQIPYSQVSPSISEPSSSEPSFDPSPSASITPPAHATPQTWPYALLPVGLVALCLLIVCFVSVRRELRTRIGVHRESQRVELETRMTCHEWQEYP